MSAAVASHLFVSIDTVLFFFGGGLSAANMCFFLTVVPAHLASAASDLTFSLNRLPLVVF